MLGRKPRFPGAGSSVDAEVYRQLKQNIRADWKSWGAIVAVTAAFVVWSELVTGNAARFTAFTAGAGVGMLLFMVGLGGHISTFMWSLGAEGERVTGKEIEKLSNKDWHCEHSIKHAHGDWDHVLIGPPGIFLVDSKRLNNTAVVASDALHSGRLRFNGGLFRGGAWDVNKALEAWLGRRAPFVTPVVAIWGDFPQEWVEEGEKPVVYVRGERIASWLGGLPEKLTAPERAALVTALKQARADLADCAPAS